MLNASRRRRVPPCVRCWRIGPGPSAAPSNRAASRSSATNLLEGPAPSIVEGLPAGAEWRAAGHPMPNDESVAGARRALEIARGASEADLLVLLLSGGGSALMALPADGVTLAEKQQTAGCMDQAPTSSDQHGAQAPVRDQGGRLAATTRGAVHAGGVGRRWR